METTPKNFMTSVRLDDPLLQFPQTGKNVILEMNATDFLVKYDKWKEYQRSLGYALENCKAVQKEYLLPETAKEILEPLRQNLENLKGGAALFGGTKILKRFQPELSAVIQKIENAIEIVSKFDDA